MNIPDAAWSNNSLLAPPADKQFAGPEDGVINHDHYIYGTPRKWVKRARGNGWKLPFPADYHVQSGPVGR